MAPRIGKQLLRQYVFGEEQGHKAEQEDARRVGEGHHGAEEYGVLEGAARAHKIGCHNGLAVTGRHGVHGAQTEGHGDTDQGQLPADFVAMQQAGKVIAFHHLSRRRGAGRRARGRGWIRAGRGYRDGCGRGRGFDGTGRWRGGGGPGKCSLEFLGRRHHRVLRIGRQGGAATLAAGTDDLLPAAPSRVIAIFVGEGARRGVHLQIRRDARHLHVPRPFRQSEVRAQDAGGDPAAVHRDLEVGGPLARLLDRLLLGIGAGAPLLEHFEGGDLGQIHHVADGDAVRARFQLGVMVHAEVSHGVGGGQAGESPANNDASRVSLFAI